MPIDIGIDHLTRVDLIGRGGFGSVYAAWDARFDRRVAVKVLGRLLNERDRSSFERECQIMGRMSAHPNVVTVHDAGFTTNEQPYLIMELVAGGSLADRLQQTGPIPWTEAVGYALPIADALGNGHDQGVEHRDVKPDNILLAGDHPKLTDFGIARLRDAAGATSTKITASWHHTPPETFSNARDHRSDLYSLVSTLHALITGNPPFWNPDDTSLPPLMFRLLSQPPPTLPPHLGPTPLASFLQWGMAKEPDQRPQSAEILARELRSVLDGGAWHLPLREPATRPDAPLPTPPAEPHWPSPGSTPIPAVDSPAQTVAAPVRSSPTTGASREVPSGWAPHPPIPLTGPPRPSPSGGRQSPTALLLISGAALAFFMLVAIGLNALLPLSDPNDPVDADLEALSNGQSGDTDRDDTDAASADRGASSSTEPGEEGPDDAAAVDSVVLERHTAPVLALAVLPDSRVVSASQDHSVMTWNPDETDRVPDVYAGHSDPVQAVVVLPDGRVASGCACGSVQIWDPDDPATEAQFYTGHVDAIRALAVLPDGRVASSSDDTTVQVWNPNDVDAPAFVFTGHSDPVQALSVLADGRVVSGCACGSVQVWTPDRADAEAESSSYGGHDDEILSLVVLPDGRIASAGADATVQVWDPNDLAARPYVYPGHRLAIHGLASLPDGRIASASDDQTVQVWNPDPTATSATTFTGHHASVLTVAVLPDGRIASAGDDLSVQIWDPTTIHG